MVFGIAWTQSTDTVLQGGGALALFFGAGCLFLGVKSLFRGRR